MNVNTSVSGAGSNSVAIEAGSINNIAGLDSALRGSYTDYLAVFYQNLLYRAVCQHFGSVLYSAAGKSQSCPKGPADTGSGSPQSTLYIRRQIRFLGQNSFFVNYFQTFDTVSDAARE